MRFLILTSLASKLCFPQVWPSAKIKSQSLSISRKVKKNVLLTQLRSFSLCCLPNRTSGQIGNDKAVDFITVKSERRSHRLNVADILYVEGMGNYVTYHLQGGDKKMVYSSLKEAQAQLPESFIRLHRSYLINKNAIESFDNEQVFISGRSIPRGGDIEDPQLMV